MGLATVYGIVKQNSGYVYVTREKDKGTSFKLLFPSMNDFETDDFLSARRSTKIPIGKETILLVVDDEITLNLGKTLLEKLNYTVICAGFPQKALELARSYPGEIDLLLTDVVMPQMNGKELAKQISTLRPSIKCLFMSGYPATVISNHGVLEKGVVFIKKPFTLRHLAEKLREVLNHGE